jgi:hypothetical protein
MERWFFVVQNVTTQVGVKRRFLIYVGAISASIKNLQSRNIVS